MQTITIANMPCNRDAAEERVQKLVDMIGAASWFVSAGAAPVGGSFDLVVSVDSTLGSELEATQTVLDAIASRALA